MCVMIALIQVIQMLDWVATLVLPMYHYYPSQDVVTA